MRNFYSPNGNVMKRGWRGLNRDDGKRRSDSDIHKKLTFRLYVKGRR